MFCKFIRAAKDAPDLDVTEHKKEFFSLQRSGQRHSIAESQFSNGYKTEISRNIKYFVSFLILEGEYLVSRREPPMTFVSSVYGLDRSKIIAKIQASKNITQFGASEVTTPNFARDNESQISETPELDSTS